MGHGRHGVATDARPGYRWLAMLESGEAKSLREIAALEGVDNSYVSRMINLTTLAPDIVDAILLNELPDHLTLFDLASDTPHSWDAQRDLLNPSDWQVRPGNDPLASKLVN